MKATRSILAGLVLAATAVPAFAAEDGLPANIAQRQAGSLGASVAQVNVDRSQVTVPAFLNTARGEDTLIENPAAIARESDRSIPLTSASVIRTQSVPATSYVGA